VKVSLIRVTQLIIRIVISLPEPHRRCRDIDLQRK
jgi:hypothetical protein